MAGRPNPVAGPHQVRSNNINQLIQDGKFEQAVELLEVNSYFNDLNEQSLGNDDFIRHLLEVLPDSILEVFFKYCFDDKLSQGTRERMLGVLFEQLKKSGHDLEHAVEDLPDIVSDLITEGDKCIAVFKRLLELGLDPNMTIRDRPLFLDAVHWRNYDAVKLIMKCPQFKVTSTIKTALSTEIRQMQEFEARLNKLQVDDDAE